MKVDDKRKRTIKVATDVVEERARQDARFGDQSMYPDLCPVLTKRVGGASPERHADDLGCLAADGAKEVCRSAFKNGRPHFGAILNEEFCEAIEQAALGNQKNLREELVQVAAVAILWIEAIDRRAERTEPK